MKRFSLFRTYFTIGFIIFIIIFFHAMGWTRPVERVVQYFIIPPLTQLHDWRVRWGERWNSSTDSKQIERYQEQSTTQAFLVSELHILRDDNQELKKQLNFKETQPFRTVTAEIVSQEVNDSGKMVMINRGRAAGVIENVPVVVGGGILIGMVVKVSDDVSWIRLMNDPQSKIPATILNSNRSLGVIEGGYGMSLSMKFIPRNETVLVGDQVVTSGLQELMPRGLLIGTVAVVENEAYKPFQQAIITPNVDLSKLIFVTVILTNEKL